MKHLYKLSISCAAFASILFVGCAPAVHTSIHKSYPARSENALVTVFANTDSIPAAAEMLGNVQIKDAGFSINCNYEQVMQLANKEVNKIGGNALHILWHRTPNPLGSSCHRIAANMLLLPDTIYAESVYTNIATQTIRQSEQDFQQHNTPLLPLKKTIITGRNTMLINVGYSGIASEYILPNGAEGNPKSGLEISAAYQWTSHSGYGAGLRYNGYFSSFINGGEQLNLALHYIGAEFVLRQESRRWIFRESMGLGYARYTEKQGLSSGSLRGLGLHIQFDAEYKLTPNIGLGAGIGIYTASFPSANQLMKAYTGKSRAGIGRSSLNGGVRFYF